MTNLVSSELIEVTAAMPVPKPHVLDLTSLIPTKQAQIQIWTTQYRYGELEAAELKRLLRKKLRFTEMRAVVMDNLGAPASECGRDALLSKIVNFLDVGKDAAGAEEAVTKIKKRPAADDPEEKSDKEIPLKKIRTM